MLFVVKSSSKAAFTSLGITFASTAACSPTKQPCVFSGRCAGCAFSALCSLAQRFGCLSVPGLTTALVARLLHARFPVQFSCVCCALFFCSFLKVLEFYFCRFESRSVRLPKCPQRIPWAFFPTPSKCTSKTIANPTLVHRGKIPYSLPHRPAYASANSLRRGSCRNREVSAANRVLQHPMPARLIWEAAARRKKRRRTDTFSRVFGRVTRYCD